MSSLRTTPQVRGSFVANDTAYVGRHKEIPMSYHAQRSAGHGDRGGTFLQMKTVDVCILLLAPHQNLAVYISTSLLFFPVATLSKTNN